MHRGLNYCTLLAAAQSKDAFHLFKYGVIVEMRNSWTVLIANVTTTIAAHGVQ